MTDRESKLNTILSAQPIASGLAVGQAFVYQDILQRNHELYDITGKYELEHEYARIEQAIEEVSHDLELSAKSVKK